MAQKKKKGKESSSLSLILTAHDTQLITGRFEKQPQMRTPWNRHLERKTQSHLCICWSAQHRAAGTLNYLSIWRMPQHFTNFQTFKNHLSLKYVPADTNTQRRGGWRREGGLGGWKMLLKMRRRGQRIDPGQRYSADSPTKEPSVDAPITQQTHTCTSHYDFFISLTCGCNGKTIN